LGRFKSKEKGEEVEARERETMGCVQNLFPFSEAKDERRTVIVI
jgi:hypothetical protein